MLDLANKYCITLIPVYIPTHLNMDADYLLWGRLIPDWHFVPQIAQAAFQLLGSARGGSVGIVTYQSISALLLLGKSAMSGSPGVECF